MSLNLKDLDTSSLSSSEMFALAARLMEDAEKAAQKEFDSTINFLNEKLGKMGRNKTQAVQALITLMDDTERRECLKSITGGKPTRSLRTPGKVNGTGGKKKDPSQYADWDGESRAVVGKTYRLPGNPDVTYTRPAFGAINKQFLAAVRGGAKWSEMEVRSH